MMNSDSVIFIKGITSKEDIRKQLGINLDDKAKLLIAVYETECFETSYIECYSWVYLLYRLNDKYFEILTGDLSSHNIKYKWKNQQVFLLVLEDRAQRNLFSYYGPSRSKILEQFKNLKETKILPVNLKDE
jgi:hypothetical protein